MIPPLSYEAILAALKYHDVARKRIRRFLRRCRKAGLPAPDCFNLHAGTFTFLWYDHRADNSVVSVVVDIEHAGLELQATHQHLDEGKTPDRVLNDIDCDWKDAPRDLPAFIAGIFEKAS